MAKAINNKLDIVVMGIENASNVLNKKRNNISAFESNYPREKRKERITKISLCISACIAYFAGLLYALEIDSDNLLVFIFFFGVVVIVLLAMIKPKNKIDKQLPLIEDEKKLCNYIESNIESISNLLKKKDNLYDFYITASQDAHVFVYVSAELDKDNQEIGKFNSFYVNDITIINDSKYCTLNIEENEEYRCGYKINLMIPYTLYKKIATWL